jgi:hypothetical protein
VGPNLGYQSANRFGGGQVALILVNGNDLVERSQYAL